MNRILNTPRLRRHPKAASLPPHSTMNAEVRDAIFQKLAFKGDEMKRYQAAVLYMALALWPAEIAADDVPVELRPENATTAGCVFALLKSEGLRLFDRVGRRASRSPGRNCAWINTYHLTSVALARAWLKANGFEEFTIYDTRFTSGQMEMAGLSVVNGP